MKTFFIRWFATTLGVGLAAAWVNGFQVDSTATAIIAALIIAAVSAFFTKLLNLLFALRVHFHAGQPPSTPQPPPRPGEMKSVEGRVIEADEK